MLAVAGWMRVPSLRTRRDAVTLVVLMAGFLVLSGVAHRWTLWFVGGFFAILGLAMLPIGRLPVDMPVRGEPGYRGLARRGRLAVLLLVVGGAAWGVVVAVDH
jgi:hypothetical protein